MIDRRQWLGGAVGTLGGFGGVARRVLAADRFDGLPELFARIEARRGGRLGVAVLDTASGRRTGYRTDERFPFCSTLKLLAAGAVLARIDSGRDSLEQRIPFSKQDLVAHSPATAQQAGGEGMTLAAICEAAITLSDNTAGNLMLRTVGGPAGLTGWLRGLGDQVTRSDRWETALNEAKPGDKRDTTSPVAMLTDVQALTLGTVLSPGSRARLVGWMRGNTLGAARLQAGLHGWTTADKTGTSDFTTNDVGLFWPPGRSAPVVITAFLTQGPVADAVRETALADVGAAVGHAMAA